MNSRITIKDKITVLVGAIRSRARHAGYDPATLSAQQAANFGEMQGYQTGTIAGAFYRNCTDRQWKRVLKELGVNQ